MGEYILNKTWKAIDQMGESAFSQLQAEEETILATIGTSYQLQGVFSDNGTNKEFTTSADGTITYIGEGRKFTQAGSSTSKVNKACHIDYEMYKNDVLIGITPHGFTNLSKEESFSIVGKMVLVTGDTFKIKAKSDTSNVTLTLTSFNFIFS